MSSSYQREPLTGVIRQGKDIVGAVCLPDDENIHEFIEQFNHCYGPMRMRIETDRPLPPRPTKVIVPVGASYRQVLRPPQVAGES